MGDTLKLRDFCEHPITNRAVGDVPGVGPVAARKLTSRGYFKAQDLYEKLKKQGFDENKFRVWITINALGAKASVIYRALMMWDRQFNGHAEDSDSASTSQSAARESASAQRKSFNSESLPQRATPTPKAVESMSFPTMLCRCFSPPVRIRIITFYLISITI